MSERKLPTIYTCFPGGKHKVLTMSYDDGKLEDRRLISIFNKYGIKCTFHLNSGLEMTHVFRLLNTRNSTKDMKFPAIH